MVTMRSYAAQSCAWHTDCHPLVDQTSKLESNLPKTSKIQWTVGTQKPWKVPDIFSQPSFDYEVQVQTKETNPPRKTCCKYFELSMDPKN